MTKTRHNGQVSFNLRSLYERRLYEHAYKPEHGEFSKYIKRLIERDINGVAASFNAPVNDSIEISDDDVGGFL
ncbi:hypothetical protein SAMN05518872_102412 [Psychrobacillus sp. OK032]|nr:hypothetical protein SAMN05518872_102412 [Psychrobacillus sp. OK032]